RKPSLVWNVMSTTASTGKGLNTASTSRESRVVVPVGKYHVFDGDEAHGLLASSAPAAFVTRRSTTMSGSLVSTTAAANGDGCRSARCSSALDRALTASCLETGLSFATAAAPSASPTAAAGYDVTKTEAAVAPGFAITTVASNDAP